MRFVQLSTCTCRCVHTRSLHYASASFIYIHKYMLSCARVFFLPRDHTSLYIMYMWRFSLQQINAQVSSDVVVLQDGATSVFSCQWPKDKLPLEKRQLSELQCGAWVEGRAGPWCLLRASESPKYRIRSFCIASSSEAGALAAIGQL